MDKKKKQINRETKEWEKEELAYLKVIGENIIRIKKEKKLTSKEIYEILDIDKSNYRRIEAGKTNVSVLLLKRIANTLSVKLNELVES
jgi:transcriptional regulator with XRE-family HTH domain